MTEQLAGESRWRHRISVRLYLGLGSAVALTMVASLVAWLSFGEVEDAQVRVNELSVPEMAAAFGVARRVGALVDAAPRLTTAASPEQMAGVIIDISTARRGLEENLEALARLEVDPEGVSRIRRSGEVLVSNIGAIEQSVVQRFDLAQRSEAVRWQLEHLQTEFSRILVPVIDTQFFYASTGYLDRERPPADLTAEFRERQFNRYRLLAELQASAAIGTQILVNAYSLSDVDLLEPLRERFEATAERARRNLAVLDDSTVRSEVAPLFDQLLSLATGEGGGFDLRGSELRLAAREREILVRNREQAAALAAEVEALVEAARASVAGATVASKRTMVLGQQLLLILNGVAIVGAIVIAWLLVGRSLIRRLADLSRRMRQMAQGKLEEEVVVQGRDEVAEMASALEIFRRRSLDAQRLDLVQELAEELQHKNDSLESALADLSKAQDQIVVREKLAALGELTAGVAHEIKNPLNFVKNFSEVSMELLEELDEMIRDKVEQMEENDRSMVREIEDDLQENLRLIHSHGDRADRIVHDMLKMGRGSGERQMTKVNDLFEEHARLAYHSARATDSEFQLTINEDLDPEVGELNVVSQEIGRVFLNLVSNACYAADQKRRMLEGGDSGTVGADGEPFAPTMWLTTKREGDRVRFKVRDNGNGIPPDVIDKIFNPFFTTKPTDKGTGLGLALSNDIVREHGGAIHVESEAGEFTEFVVELPLEQSETSESDAGTEDQPGAAAGDSDAQPA